MEFDPAKDKENRRKHGISLARAAEFDMSAAAIEVDDREDYGEERFNALGFLDGDLYSLTFTMRGLPFVRSVCEKPVAKKGGVITMRTKTSGPDEENPLWTAERIQTAMRFSDLPPAMQKATAPKKPRGPQKEPTKQLISIRLSPDVLEALRAKGRGWQALADEALRERFVGVK